MPSQTSEEDMSKADLIDDIAQRTGSAKNKVAAMLDAMAETAKAAVASGKDMTIPGVGKISTRTTAARMGRNPATGESVSIPSKVAVTFKVAKSLKDAANG